MNLLDLTFSLSHESILYWIFKSTKSFFHLLHSVDDACIWSSCFSFPKFLLFVLFIASISIFRSWTLSFTCLIVLPWLSFSLFFVLFYFPSIYCKGTILMLNLLLLLPSFSPYRAALLFLLTSFECITGMTTGELFVIDRDRFLWVSPAQVSGIKGLLIN